MKNNQSKEQPIKGWVKAKDRTPEIPNRCFRQMWVSKANSEISQWMYFNGAIDEYDRVYDVDSSVDPIDQDNVEWLDETPIQSGEERLLAEIAELKAWKESMISVTPDMQEIGKALGVRLGESIHDKILPGIERLNKLIETAHDVGYLNYEKMSLIISWQQFKQINQL